MRIVIISDAWYPQINGVYKTLVNTINDLEELGHQITVVHPGLFKTFPMPFYEEIPITYGIKNIGSYLKSPCAIHIATEGSLGIVFNAYCCLNKIPFTTSYHTNYPDYLWKYLCVPKFLTYSYLKVFHGASGGVMVATPTLENKLMKNGFKNLKVWSRGVDTELFKPQVKQNTTKLLLYVGRIAKEKNLKAFLDLNIDNTEKIIVGDGPYLSYLKRKYRKAHFLGALQGEELQKVYRHCDCFVFPSKTDTFGLVLLEALASGLSIAAYPVEGPIDIWDGDFATGCLSGNLEHAVLKALKCGKSDSCRKLALQYTWRQCTMQFLSNLAIYQ